VDPSFDFLPPPPAFTLVNADFTLKNNLFGNPVQISFSVQNLLNTKYRNYLNRFRYFADEPGRSFDLTLLYNF
jgi:iron complex outermembrane receptor protein